MANYYQAYTFFSGLIVMFSKILPVVGPFIILYFIVSFLRWVMAQSRGKDTYDDYVEDYATMSDGYKKIEPRYQKAKRRW
jgi:hypothetical protein